MNEKFPINQWTLGDYLTARDILMEMARLYLARNRDEAAGELKNAIAQLTRIADEKDKIITKGTTPD